MKEETNNDHIKCDECGKNTKDYYNTIETSSVIKSDNDCSGIPKSETKHKKVCTECMDSKSSQQDKDDV